MLCVYVLVHVIFMCMDVRYVFVIFNVVNVCMYVCYVGYAWMSVCVYVILLCYV